MFNKKQEQQIKETIEEVVGRIVRESLRDATTLASKIKTLNELEKQIKELELDKKNREWEYEKKERDIEHKVGLERKRQEVELDHAKRDAVLTVREESLAAKQDQFQKQMDFTTKRFETEVTYLKEILEKVLEAVQGVKNNGKSD